MAWFETDAAQAWGDLARNAHAKWPARDPKGSRLEPIARPNFAADFTIAPSDGLFTIGSCFARNVERALGEAGFQIPARAFRVPPEELDEIGGDDPSQILNKYTPFSMEQEVAFALAPNPPFTMDDCLVEVDDGLVYDLQLAFGKAVSRARAEERREEVRSLFQHIRVARVVFVTLGLSETWFDRETGLHLNRPVPLNVARRYPGRFTFRVADIDEVRASTLRLVDILKSAMPSDGRIVMTVSPVPLKATFSGQDVLVANTYSKAALRVAAEEARASRNGVHYYPSFETVALSNARDALYGDLRHVRDELVRYITGRFVAAVAGGSLDVEGQVAVLESRIAAGEVEESRQELAALVDANPDRLDLKQRLAELHIQTGQHAAAIARLDEILAIHALDRAALLLKGQALFEAESWQAALATFERLARVGHREAAHWVGRCRLRLGETRAAIEAFSSVDPKAATYMDSRYWLGTALIASGEIEQATRTLEGLIEARPGHSAAYGKLAEAYLAAGDHDTARGHAATLASLRPDFWFTHYVNGLVAKAAGDIPNARASLEKAYALRPDGLVERALAALNAQPTVASGERVL